MMYMPDALQATIKLMESPSEKIKIRSSYNLGGISITPNKLVHEIRNYIPNFKISYKPDFRQEIANSWPCSISDKYAQNDWGWEPQYDFNYAYDDYIIPAIRKKYNLRRA